MPRPRIVMPLVVLAWTAFLRELEVQLRLSESINEYVRIGLQSNLPCRSYTQRAQPTWSTPP